MRTITAKPLTKESFAPYGRYINMYEERRTTSEDFDAYMVRELQMRGRTKLGVTFCKAGDFDSLSMERHCLTEELLVNGDAPTVLTVANTDPNAAPHQDDVAAFIMNTGDVVVLHKGIWHDANHGVDKDTMYYFMVSDTDDGNPREIEFVPVQPEPVHVTARN